MKHTLRLLEKDKEQYIIYAKNNRASGDNRIADEQLKIISELDEAINILKQSKLGSVSSSFSSEDTHLCMAHLDKEKTCMVCGKRNCC